LPRFKLALLLGLLIVAKLRLLLEVASLMLCRGEIETGLLILVVKMKVLSLILIVIALHVVLLLKLGLVHLVALVAASPGNARVPVHLKRGQGLLALVDWVHHELVDLPVDEQVLTA